MRPSRIGEKDHGAASRSTTPWLRRWSADALGPPPSCSVQRSCRARPGSQGPPGVSAVVPLADASASAGETPRCPASALSLTSSASTSSPTEARRPATCMAIRACSSSRPAVRPSPPPSTGDRLHLLRRAPPHHGAGPRGTGLLLGPGLRPPKRHGDHLPVGLRPQGDPVQRLPAAGGSGAQGGSFPICHHGEAPVSPVVAVTRASPSRTPPA